tara:strand:+ start:6861 stop:7469 length:609 start_codon:yes stop_codon:yes gene_type:complete
MNSYKILFNLSEGKQKGKAKKAAQRFATLQQQKLTKARGSRGTGRLRDVDTELKKQGYDHLDVIDNPQHRDTAEDAIKLHRGKDCVGNACKTIVDRHATERGLKGQQNTSMGRGRIDIGLVRANKDRKEENTMINMNGYERILEMFGGGGGTPSHSTPGHKKRMKDHIKRIQGDPRFEEPSEESKKAGRAGAKATKKKKEKK